MNAFRVHIAGQDQTATFTSLYGGRYESLMADQRLKVKSGALDEGLLRDVTSPDALDRAFMELLRHRSQIDTLPFDFPRKPGLAGAVMFKVRAFLWKLLRYQHDRMSSRQNRVNAWMINSLEAQVATLNDKVEDLRKQLERTTGSAGKEH